MKDGLSPSSSLPGALLTIRSLINAIGRTERIEELYEAALNALTGARGANRASILLIDPDGVWRIKACRGLSERYRASGEGFTPWASSDNDPQAVLVADLRREPLAEAIRSAMLDEGIAAVAFIPLVGPGGLLGRLTLYDDSPRQFPSEDIQLAHIIAAHLAFAIEQKRAALASKASEERFSKAFSANPDPMAIHATRDGRFVEVNQSFLQIGGYTKEEVIGRTIADLKYLVDPADFSKAAEILREQGRLKEYEFQFRTKNGDIRWGLISAEPIDIGGEHYILSTTSDVTARKQIEAVLQRQAQRTALRSDISNAFSRRCSLQEILQRCTEAITTRLQAVFARIWLLEEPGEFLRLAASAGIYTHLDGEHSRIRVGDLKIGRIAETRQPKLTNDLPNDPSVSDLDWVIQERIVAFAGYPLIVDDRLVGVMGMFSRCALTNDTMSALGSIADTIAQGIERRQTEERLTHEHGFRRAIEDSMLAGVVTIDLQWKQTYVNPAFCEIFGWSAEEMLGVAAPFPYWPPEETETIQAAFNATLDGTINQKGFELRVMRRSGERFDALVLISLLKNRDAQPTGWLAAIHDISDRKRIERERERLLASEQAARAQAESSALLHRTAEEQLSALVEASGVLLSSLEPDAVLSAILDLSRRLITADAYAVWRYREAAGRWEIGCADGLSEEYQRAATDDPAGAQSVGGAPVVAEDVEREPILAHRRPLYGSEGIRSLLSVPLRVWSRDSGTITFYFRTPHRFDLVEIRIATALANLASAAISTSESFHEQMRLRVEAEDANRLKDEFLATVSHELRTPLTPLLGWTHMLRHQKVSDAMLANALEIIERNVRAQTQIVNDILDVSRIMTGKLRLEINPTNLPPIVEAAVETVTPAAVGKQIRITTSLDPRLNAVHCDPDRLQQIVWNLLTNAIKFTAEGGEVDIAVKRRGGKAQIVVRDTGQGISAEFLPHVFDRFRQADSSYTRRHGGLGLGLAIVRHLVELHGGTVEAHSPGLGQGATFVVSLPLVDAIDSPPEDLEEAAGAASSRVLEDLRLLLVDDEPDTLEVLAMTLRHNGAQVRAVGSAAVAYEVAREWQPDVVISDIGMQEEDGYVFLGRIRSLGEERGGLVPAIALTAYASEEDRQRATLAGYQLHLAKPIDPAQLVMEILKLAGRE